MAEKYSPKWELHCQDTATSALDVAKDFIENSELLPQGNAFLVAEQTAGRGRMGRTWISHKNDGMYLSVILSPKRAQAEWPTLSFVASLAAIHTLNSACPNVPVSLKWPNDLMAEDRKLGGVLLEADGPHAIVGCGVNIKNAPRIYDSMRLSTDIAKYQSIIPEPKKLAEAYINNLKNLFQIWQNFGPAPLLARWQDKSNIIGRHITVGLFDKTVTGICDALEPDGRLNLVDIDGNVHLITAGDVVLMGEVNASRD